KCHFCDKARSILQVLYSLLKTEKEDTTKPPLIPKNILLKMSDCYAEKPYIDGFVASNAQSSLPYMLA
ncbi:hypothetical protein ACTGYS_12800, partial [Streptococcus suis]